MFLEIKARDRYALTLTYLPVPSFILALIKASRVEEVFINKIPNLNGG